MRHRSRPSKECPNLWLLGRGILEKGPPSADVEMQNDFPLLLFAISWRSGPRNKSIKIQRPTVEGCATAPENSATPESTSEHLSSEGQRAQDEHAELLLSWGFRRAKEPRRKKHSVANSPGSARVSGAEPDPIRGDRLPWVGPCGHEPRPLLMLSTSGSGPGGPARPRCGASCK